MSQGRGSASQVPAAGAVILLCLLLHSVPGDGATYTVGGAGGWTFNTSNWPKGKSFTAGDVLIFNYDSTIHNVITVDKRSYNGCKSPARAKVYNSGNDRIRLSKGQNYFICSGHCESGMKMAINAA
ncbi:hypothetical protein U1Q18_037266 [Sarracenia purpurea var. burkii]